MTQEELNEVLRLHKQWVESDGEEGKRADLHGTNLDYSVWPLWCGSFDVKCDIRLASQLAYHFCRLDCEDKEVVAAQNALITLANKFHRVEECGVLKPQTNAGELKTNKTDGRKER